MSSIKTEYGTPVTGNLGVEGLASSATWLAGFEAAVLDNSVNKWLDWGVEGKITVGTTPTAGTEIRIYLVASFDGTNWPDVFDGTASAETITSAGVRDGFAKLAAILPVDAAASDRAYPFSFKVAPHFGGIVPKKVALFVTHNTVAALNVTAGNHTYSATPEFATNA